MLTQSPVSMRRAILDRLMVRLKRELGEANALCYLGDRPDMMPQFVSTGISTLDAIYGGGFPKGRIVEIFGSESSGKTSLALHQIAQVQRQGGTAAFVDLENALDPAWATLLGVNPETLLVTQPRCGEEAIALTERLVASKAVDLIVLDSTAALCPEAEQASPMGEESVLYSPAWLMSKACRRLMHVIHTECTVVFVGQVRLNPGVVYGNPEKTTGGRALRNYASLSLEVRRMEVLGKGSCPHGVRLKVKCRKNKLAPPFRQTEVDLHFATGFQLPEQVPVSSWSSINLMNPDAAQSPHRVPV